MNTESTNADAAHRLARAAGWLYLVTFVTSIPALALKTPALEGTGLATNAHIAALIEIVLALACVGTAVTLYPILSRYEPASALGFIASRTLEATLVLVGVVALLTVVSLREGEANSEVISAVVGLHDGAFLLGPGLLPAVNAALLGGVLYRTRLVPRVIPLIGLIGAPLLAASAIATMFGAFDQVSAMAGLAALPIAVWEFALGCWLAVRGAHRKPTRQMSLASRSSSST
mgnify:FL=1